MKVSHSLIALAVVAALPLSVMAGDRDKSPAPLGTTVSADFNSLDTDGDKRISRSEASRDTKIEFAAVDKNSDGFLDSTEFAHREVSGDSTMPSTVEPSSDSAKPRQ